MKTIFVAQLPVETQDMIRKELRQVLLEEALLTSEELEELVQQGMDSRLCDLSDLIDIDKYLNP